MPSPDLKPLEAQLRQLGIAPGRIERALAELSDHFEDAAVEARKRGLADEAAARAALQSLGGIETIAAHYRARPELRSWSNRHPGTALLLLPIARFAELPVLVVDAGIQNAPAIARWGMCLLAGAAVTATLLLVMQLSIALT